MPRTPGEFRFINLIACLFVMAVMVLVAVPGWGQAENAGTVSGNVTDAQGSIVANATATLTSIDQGNVVTVKVNQRGEYLFPNVKAGGYIVTVSAPTFRNFTADSVVVNATENVRVDAKLVLGSANDTVTVEAPSATVDTRSATVATVIDPTLVQNLPVDGNNVVALAALLPGVTGVNAPTTFTSDTGGPAYIVSGSRSNQNLYLFDGLMWNNVYYNTGLNFPPSQMLTEVSVQLVNFKAQYGRNVGSVFNVLTRSGTNQIHGMLWEYMQNNAFNASDYIYQRNPHLVQNQFGASIGGPILRDKLFYYLGYQDLRSSAEVDAKAQTPTLDERGLQANGLARPCVSPQFAGQTCASYEQSFLATPAIYQAYVNGLTNVAGCPNIAAGQSSCAGLARPDYSTAYGPTAISQLQANDAVTYGTTGQSRCLNYLDSVLGVPVQGATGPGQRYLPNAELPSVCFNPISVAVLAKYLPLPNPANPAEVVGSGLPYAVTSAVQPRNDQNGLARADWILPNHTIDARFYVTNVNDFTSNSVNPNVLSVANYEIDANAAGIYDGNIGDTWVIRPNLLNVFRTGYKRYNYAIVPTDPTTLNTLGGVLNTPGHPTLPSFNINSRWAVGAGSTPYNYNVNANYEANENLTWTKGNQNLQFGGQYLNLQYVRRTDSTPNLSFGGNFTSVSEADFMLGLLSTVQVGNGTNIGAIDHAYYFYAQDDWRATPRLTLNLGLRYELELPWTQPDGESVTFVAGYQSQKFPNTPANFAYEGDPGIPKSIVATTYRNLAPRFGLAYDLSGDGKTAIRAGFGIFYDALNANTVGSGSPYHYAAVYNQGQNTSSGGISNPLYNEPAVPANYTNPANALFTTPYSVNFADPHITQPYTMAVNLGIQQRLGAASIEVVYVGKFGRHAIVPYDLNPAIIDCTGSYYQSAPTVYCPQQAGNSAYTIAASYTARVKYPGFNYGGQGIVDNNSVGTSNYNGLQMIYTQRARGNLTTTMSYTYSRSLDDQSSGTTNSAAVEFTPNVNTNYGPSDFQATHIFNMGWTLRLPNVQRGYKVERAVLNDWSFGGIFNARTGNPFSVYLGSDGTGTDEKPQRAGLQPGYTIANAKLPSNRHRSCPLPGANNCKVQEWFNVGAFESNPYPATGTPSLSVTPDRIYNDETIPGRNSLYGPAFLQTDMNLNKRIPLEYRGMSLEMRADALNVWNTPNLANPVTTLSQGTSVGQVATNSAGNILATVGKNGSVGTNGRRIQFAFILHY